MPNSCVGIIYNAGIFLFFCFPEINHIIEFFRLLNVLLNLWKSVVLLIANVAFHSIYGQFINTDAWCMTFQSSRQFYASGKLYRYYRRLVHIERNFSLTSLTKLIYHIPSFHRLPKWQIMPSFRKFVIFCLLCLPWFLSPHDWVYFLSGEYANLLSDRTTPSG